MYRPQIQRVLIESARNTARRRRITLGGRINLNTGSNDAPLDCRRCFPSSVSRSFASQSSSKDDISNQKKSNNNNNNNNRNRRFDNSSNNNNSRNVMSVQSITERMEKLRRKNAELTLPPIWLVHNPAHNTKEQLTMLEATRKLLQALEHSISEGRINPQGRASQDIANLLSTALTIFQISYNDCVKVFQFAEKWRLPLSSHHHRDCAIYAACGEGRWEEASARFRETTDPDMAGYTPVDIRVDHPIGLYAVARGAIETGSAVAEQVMDAALSMSMVSPTDQEKYVLAAGTALGHAGAWQSLVEYYHNSINSSRLGQPLVAATMHACLLNGQRREAIQLYDDFVGSNSVSSEWQWGGGAHTLTPLTRDLAMRASHPQALRLFEESQEEHCQVSDEALLGVLRKLSNWKDILSVFSKMVERQGTGWVVGGDELDIAEYVQKEGAAGGVDEQVRCERVMEAVMMALNSNQQFSMSLICAMLYHNARHPNHTAEEWDEGLVHFIMQTSSPGDTLIAIMASLCGLSAPDCAKRVHDMVVGASTEGASFSVSEIHDFATGAIVRGQSSNNEIIQLLKNLHFLCRRAIDCRAGNVGRSSVSESLQILVRTMQSLSMANQPESSLFLLETMLVSLALALAKAKNRKGKASNLFAVGTISTSTSDNFLKLDDSLLAETVRALRVAGLQEEAVETFERVTADDTMFPPYSTQQMLQVLVDVGQEQDAINFFKSLPSASRTPESYALIGAILENQSKWNAIGELYHLAKNEGCLSENLVFQAMKGVESSSFDGKMKILRTLGRDAAKLVGMEPREWLHARYWSMKRKLGEHYSHLLMWWNDKRISGAKEFELAIHQFYERTQAGLKPKNDVLKAIVYHCGNLDRLPNSIFKWENTVLPQTEEDFSELLTAVATACEESNLFSNPRFMASLISVLLLHGSVSQATLVLGKCLERGILVEEGIIQEVSKKAAQMEVPVSGRILTVRQEIPN